MSNNKVNALSLLMAMLIFVVSPASADNLSPGIQTNFNWQVNNAWGKINFGAGVDPGIPSTKLQPKADIKNLVKQCGTNLTDLASLRVRKIDIDSDGRQDVVIDSVGYFYEASGSGYTPKYLNASNCHVEICSQTEGCLISIYHFSEPTMLVSEPPVPPSAAASNDVDPPPVCPETAEDNTSCKTYCPSTEHFCPANFKYNTQVLFNQKVKRWNFISALDFTAWATGKLMYGLNNANPVLVTKLADSKCYSVEKSLNGGLCIKYYQYAEDTNHVWRFLDLFTYRPGIENEDDQAYYTPDDFNRDVARNARGTPFGGGFGFKFDSGQTINFQIPDFVRTNNDGTTNSAAFLALQIKNLGDKSYFVPTNTDKELSSFLNHPPAGVEITNAKMNFTSWEGETNCPDMIPRGTTQNIAAERFCQRATGAYTSCSKCIDSPEVTAADKLQGCTWNQVCEGNACMFNESPADEYIGSAELKLYHGTYTTVQECYAQKAIKDAGGSPTGLWGELYRSNGYGAPNAVEEYGGCDGAFNHICEQGNFCLAGDTLIDTPKGKHKRLDQIKIGDVVLGFKKPLDVLKPYKVKTVAITPKQPILSLNNGVLQLTPNHEVIMVDGVRRRASQLKLGDIITRGDGSPLVVTRVDRFSPVATVYNLVLEDNAGFVAGGIRVMGYK